jgi:hypothetical protein
MGKKSSIPTYLNIAPEGNIIFSKKYVSTATSRSSTSIYLPGEGAVSAVVLHALLLLLAEDLPSFPL